MEMMGNQLCLLLAFLFCSLPTTQSYLWAWLYSLPEYNAVASSKNAGLLSNLELKMTTCSHDKECPEGLFCDHHFGLCFSLRNEGEFCRQDAHCAKGLICMFGKCQESVPVGQEGSRCLHNNDCGPENCCARHHGEMVCRKRLLLDEGCYVPEGGIAFSMNQVCPCLEGLVCKKIPLNREAPFEYSTDKSNWRCQKK